MHLLNVETRRLEQFMENNTPQYVILSHTWGDDEATFQQYQIPKESPTCDQRHSFRPQIHNNLKRRRQRKDRWQPISSQSRLQGPGHAKIRACCRQAKAAGFQYVWIDTCCIDKRSSAELSEAINSMFSWYKRAAVCYVYLADVLPLNNDLGHVNELPEVKNSSTIKHDNSGASLSLHSTQIVDIENSRWFTRGWTLQEMLAPDRLEIFDSGWNLIGYSYRRDHGANSLVCGEKNVPRLTELLSATSGVPYRFLWDCETQTACVAERMRWASKRTTTRTEDLAYCLLGIFDVNMSMIYGEGSHAFDRLQREIIRKYDDHSILAFGRLNDEQHPFKFSLDSLMNAQEVPTSSGGHGQVRASCLATSPHAFAQSHGLVRQTTIALAKHYSVTNLGVSIDLPMRELPTGEWIARLDCTKHTARYTSHYLCLILIPLYDRENVFTRRAEGSLIFMPRYYFLQNQYRRSIYLSSLIPTASYRKGPLTISGSFLAIFRIRATYPPIRDRKNGSQLTWMILRAEERGYSEIYLDCADYDSQLFALRAVIPVYQDENMDGEEVMTKSEALLSICHQRRRFCMAGLMLNAPRAVAPGTTTAAQNNTSAQEPTIRWDSEVFVGAHEVFLADIGNGRWTIDARAQKRDITTSSIMQHDYRGGLSDPFGGQKLV